ncbi:hypothetical protein BH20ACI3_BH20ACI3_19350 [soil metagenome]
MTEANTPKTSTITCPHCGFQRAEEMPVDACLFFMNVLGVTRDLSHCRVTVVCSVRMEPKSVHRSNVSKFQLLVPVKRLIETC